MGQVWQATWHGMHAPRCTLTPCLPWASEPAWPSSFPPTSPLPPPTPPCTTARHAILYDMGSGTTVVALVRYSSYTIKEGGKPKAISQLEVGPRAHWCVRQYPPAAAGLGCGGLGGGCGGAKVWVQLCLALAPH